MGKDTAKARAAKNVLLALGYSDNQAKNLLDSVGSLEAYEALKSHGKRWSPDLQRWLTIKRGPNKPSKAKPTRYEYASFYTVVPAGTEDNVIATWRELGDLAEYAVTVEKSQNYGKSGDFRRIYLRFRREVKIG